MVKSKWYISNGITNMTNTDMNTKEKAIWCNGKLRCIVPAEQAKQVAAIYLMIYPKYKQIEIKDIKI